MTTITEPQSQALWMLNSLMVERVTADQTNYAVVDDTAHLYEFASPGGITYRLDDIAEAHADREAGRATGKLVVLP